MRFSLGMRLGLLRIFDIGIFDTDKDIAGCLENMKISEMVERCILYLNGAKNGSAIYCRYARIVRLIGGLCEKMKSSEAQERLKELHGSFCWKREKFLLEYVNYLAATGENQKLRSILRNAGMSDAVRTQVEQALTGCKVYNYCSVRFSGESKKLYYYRTELEHIRAGDSVCVPVGKANDIALAQVVRVRKYTETKVPRALEDTKFILTLEEDE